MSEPELRLNSLARFSKRSPNLVLEEYSSCEVPAGCGGVVLRWRRPDEPVPMVISLFTGSSKREDLALDGGEPAHWTRLPIGLGNHVFTFTITEVDVRFACLLFFARLHDQYVRVMHLQGDTVLLSLPDGTWRYTLEEPRDDAWKRPGYDDAGWAPLVEKPFGPLPSNYQGSVESWTRRETEQGAKGLGIEVSPSIAGQIRALLGGQPVVPRVYIRKEFEVFRSEEE